MPSWITNHLLFFVHSAADTKMIPIENYGVKCMSMGFLVEKDAPIVWRGPMVSAFASMLEHFSRLLQWFTLT